MQRGARTWSGREVGKETTVRGGAKTIRAAGAATIKGRAKASKRAPPAMGRREIRATRGQAAAKKGVGRTQRSASPALGRGRLCAPREGEARVRERAVLESCRAIERQIVKTKPESQWIVTTRPLYHVQQPVSYSSRLQGIHRAGSGICDRSRLIRYGCAWLPRRGGWLSFQYGF